MLKRDIIREIDALLDDPDFVEATVIAKIDAMLWVLFPDGIKPNHYADLVRIVRVLDRLCGMVEPANAAITADLPTVLSGQQADEGRRAEVLPRTDVPRHTDPSPQADLPPQTEVAVIVPSDRAAGAGAADAEAVVVAVADDNTAPIAAPPPFARSAKSTQPWAPVGEFSFREQVARRKPASPGYTSIFKYGPDDDDCGDADASQEPSKAAR